jgi:hypothetical protein
MSAYVARVLNDGCLTFDTRRKAFFPSRDTTYTVANRSHHNVVVSIPYMRNNIRVLTLCLDRHELLRSITAEQEDDQVFFIIELDILRNLRFKEEEICKLGDDTLNFHILKPVSGNLKDFGKHVVTKVISKHAF